jgi:hypothetical protein
VTRVTESNPAGGANLVTTYTYDVFNHLTQVQMTHGTTTQTRSWTYTRTTRDGLGPAIKVFESLAPVSFQRFEPHTFLTDVFADGDEAFASARGDGRIVEARHAVSESATSVRSRPTESHQRLAKLLITQ